MSHPATHIVPAARAALWFADKVTDGIPDASFGRKPEGVDANCPAWCIGHLSLYPAWLMEMLGIDNARPVTAEENALFDHASVCRDDPDGTVYPPKAELMERFRARQGRLIEAIGEAPAEAFAEPNPVEVMRDMFPTVGDITNFMLSSHSMMHLGQISTWRRCMGLGPCMGSPPS